MHNQTANEKLARGVAWTAKLAAATLIVAVSAFGAKHDKSRQDAFLRGDAAESQIIRNVRHELVMLSNGAFDDLPFKVEGNTVTLLGAVTRPTLRATRRPSSSGFPEWSKSSTRSKCSRFLPRMIAYGWPRTARSMGIRRCPRGTAIARYPPLTSL